MGGAARLDSTGRSPTAKRSMRAMVHEVRAADREMQLTLLRAHPDLGARARMSDASIGEQAGAGLDRMSVADYKQLQSLNLRYREKFGFPFLLAVKGVTVADILQTLEQRVGAFARSGVSGSSRPGVPDRVLPPAGYCCTMNQEPEPWNGLPAVGSRTTTGRRDVIVYRLNRDGVVPEGCCPVFGANVKMLLYGDAFWPTYTTGDNTNLVATDSMKNFIQRETLELSPASIWSPSATFSARKFIETYPQTEGIQLSAKQVPYAGVAEGAVAFAPAGPGSGDACVELRRECRHPGIVEVRSGIHGFRLLRLGGSAFQGFRARPVHHAPRHHESTAAHVARSGMELHHARRPPSARAR